MGENNEISIAMNNINNNVLLSERIDKEIYLSWQKRRYEKADRGIRKSIAQKRA